MVVEYFILFATVALLTVVGITDFDQDVRGAMEGVYQKAVVTMNQDPIEAVSDDGGDGGDVGDDSGDTGGDDGDATGDTGTDDGY